MSHKWKLLYSLDQDGVSLSTLYSRVAAGMGRKSTSSGCLLVVEDTDGCVFGAYSNEAFKRSDSYYGSGEWLVLLIVRLPRHKVSFFICGKFF